MCCTREPERSCHCNTHPQRYGPERVRETKSERENGFKRSGSKSLSNFHEWFASCTGNKHLRFNATVLNCDIALLFDISNYILKS